MTDIAGQVIGILNNIAALVQQGQQLEQQIKSQTAEATEQLRALDAAIDNAQQINAELDRVISELSKQQADVAAEAEIDTNKVIMFFALGLGMGLVVKFLRR